MANPVLTLTCGPCGFVNEAEWVYCHNCGEKLDRSVLPREEDASSKEAIERTLRRVKKMTNPQANVALRESLAAAKTFGSALGVSLLICLLRSPDDLPSSRPEPSGRMISAELAETVDWPQPRLLTLTENDINAHFKSTIRAKSGTSAIPGVTFERAFVQLLPGSCVVGLEESLWGIPFYVRLNYQVQIVNGQFEATQTGGYFGRLAIHPALMKRLDFAFNKLWAVLKRERELMNGVRSITLEKGRVSIVSKGRK